MTHESVTVAPSHPEAAGAAEKRDPQYRAMVDFLRRLTRIPRLVFALALAVLDERSALRREFHRAGARRLGGLRLP